MAYSVTISDNVRYCCGVGEVYGLVSIDKSSFDCKEVALAICAIYFYRMRKGVFLFEDVDTRQYRTKDWEESPEKYGYRVRQLAKYISENGLGTAVLCPPTVNPNSGNIITVLNWVTNSSGLDAFWAKHEPKTTEANWSLCSMPSLPHTNGVVREAYSAYRKVPAASSRTNRVLNW